MKKIHGTLHKHRTVKNGIHIFYVTARFYRSYKIGCSDEPYFVCVSFFIDNSNMNKLSFSFELSVYHKSLKGIRTIKKVFTLHNANYVFSKNVTCNDIVKGELIKGQSPTTIRNKLLKGTLSSIGYEVIEDFVRVGLPYIINNINFNELVKSMLFCKRGV